MKKKVSITLSADVLSGIDQIVRLASSRSAFIEDVLRDYLQKRSRIKMHSRDLERINRAADHLNREASEVLVFQSN